MVNNVKIFLKLILCMIYAFFSSFLFPSFLNIAFNFTHGIANNPDGEITAPIGVVIILAILVTDFLLIKRIVKDTNKTITKKIFIVIIFLFVKFAGIIIDQNGWENFFHCVSWHLKH